jgi:hypothetical protein
MFPPGVLTVLCTQTTNNRSMRFAAKLGFTQVEQLDGNEPSNGSACGPRPRHPVEFVAPRVADPRDH